VLASDDVELATSEVEEADVVVLLQTGGVLEKASVLIRMYEADTSDKPIMCILVPGAGYDFALVKNHLMELKKELRSEELKEVVRHMRERGEPAGKLGIWLSRSIPLIISVAIPINGTDNEVEASTTDFVDRLARVRINKRAGFTTKLDAEGERAMHKLARDVSRDVSRTKDNFQMLLRQTAIKGAGSCSAIPVSHAVEMVKHEADSVVHAVESVGHAVEAAAHETASAAHAAAVQLQARFRGMGLRSTMNRSDSQSALLRSCSSAAALQVAPSDAAPPVPVEITTSRVESPRPGLRESFASKKDVRPPSTMPPGQSTNGKEPVSEEHV